MNNEVDKLKKAKHIMNLLSQGVNPINGEAVTNNSFICDPRMTSCFSYISDILSKEIEYQEKKDMPDRESFDAAKIDLSKVIIPEEDCGVNIIAGCINELVDERVMKKVTGAQINKQLKAMGILSEKTDEDGRSTTTINNNSIKYGIVSVKSSYNGREYDKVVFNEKGRKYIIERLTEIMNYSGSK